MAKKILLYLIAAMFLGAVLVGGAFWYNGNQLLNQFIRPRIETLASQSLGLDVHVGQLNWRNGGLRCSHLTIEKTDQFQLIIPQLQLDFTLAELWQRHLDGLSIRHPRLEVFSVSSSSQGEKATPSVPFKLPLTINKLDISSGWLRVYHGGQQWQFQDVNFSGELQQQSHFSLSTLVGTENTQLVEIGGSVELSPQYVITLNKVLWQQQPLLTSPLSLVLNGSNFSLAENEIRLKRFDHQQLREILTAVGLSAQLPAELFFTLTAPLLKFSLEGSNSQFELQVIEGSLGWDSQSTTFSQLRLQLHQRDGGWEIAGRFQSVADSVFDFNSQLDGKGNLNGKVHIDIPDPTHFKADLLEGEPLPIVGAVKLSIDYSLRDDCLQLETKIRGWKSPFSIKSPVLNVADISGRGKFIFSGENRNFILELQQKSHPLLKAHGSFTRFDFSLLATTLNDIRLLFPHHIPEQLQAATDITLTGSIKRWEHDWSGKVHASAADMTLAGVTLSHLNSQTSFRSGEGATQLSDASFKATFNRGDELSGDVNVRWTGAFSEHQQALNIQQLSLSHLNYVSADGLTGVGEAALSLGGNVTWKKHGPLKIDLTGGMDVGEVLAGTFYADLSAYHGKFSLSGDVLPEKLQFKGDHITFELPQLGILTASGIFSRQQVKVAGDLKLTDLSESYGDHFAPLFSEMAPTLSGLTLEGQLSLDYHLTWQPDRWDARGALHISGLDGYWEQRGLEIVSGTGSLPFTIGTIEPSSVMVEESRRGHIAFSALSFGPVTMDRGYFDLATAKNRLTLLSPLILHLGGGDVEIDDFTFAVAATGPEGEAEITVSAVDLENLTAELGLPIMQGRLNADLGRLRYADHQLSSDGLVSIRVFGGQFQLQNMYCRDPFSTYPTFYTDIDFSGLNLLEATRTFDFGEMNGILDGHILGLQMFGTTPAAFEAAVATRSTGKRNISVKALNNISIISQGGLSAALSRGVYRFIDFYRYKKIGFQCSLKNDTFTLIGTALPGSKKYLVHGGLLPPRIDMTTTTPTISFKEMVKRLSRIKRTGN